MGSILHYILKKSAKTLHGTGFLSLFVLFVVLSSVPFGASDQVIEFSGLLTHPSEGPYNQEVHARVQIIRRDFSVQDEEESETVVWEKTYSPIVVYNGTLSILMDEDDSFRKINSEVFESQVDYEFDPDLNPTRISRGILPRASYALRFYFRRTLDSEEERIKPDFNFDGSPFSVSSVPLSGNSEKFGQLTVSYFPELLSERGSLIEIDPFANATASAQHGLLIENGSLEVLTSGPESQALNMEGAFYLRNVTLKTGTINISRGDIRIKSLCMSKDCKAVEPAFSSPLYVYNKMELNRFVDRDSLKETIPYTIEPSKTSRITNLEIANSGGVSAAPAVLLSGEANFTVEGRTSISLLGAGSEIDIKTGKFSLEMPEDLADTATSSKFRLKPDGEMGQDAIEKENFRKDTFHKVIADRLVNAVQNPAGDTVAGSYVIKPSGSSNIAAIQFRFENKAESLERINSRIRNRYPSNSDRLLKVIFDPILTGEMLDNLVKGDQGGNFDQLNFFEFHQHDLIGQASAQELLEIINDPRFTDNAKISAAKVSNDLIKETTLNQIWLSQAFFMQPDLLDSLFVRGNVLVNYDSAAPIVFGGNPDENRPYLGAVTSSIGNKRSLYFLKEGFANAGTILNFNAAGLRLYQNLNIRTHHDIPLPTNLFSGGEMRLLGNLDVGRDFISQGKLFLGNADGSGTQDSLINSKRVTNVFEISAPYFFNRFSEYYSAPMTSSRWLRLEAEYLGFTGPTRLLNIQGDLNIQNNLKGTDFKTENGNNWVTFDRMNTANVGYYSDPDSDSVWNDLTIIGALDISGDISVEGDIEISGQIRASDGNVSQDTRIDQDLIASAFVDLDSDPAGLGRTMLLDPNSLSRLNHLQFDLGAEMFGTPQVRGNVVVGTEFRSNLDLQINSTLYTPRFLDLDDLSYLADPNQLSRLNQLTLTSTLNTAILSAYAVQMSQNLSVGQNATFTGNGRFHSQLEVQSEIRQLALTSDQQLFRVDNDGVVYAYSADIGGDTGLRMGEFSGSLTVGRTATIIPEAYFNNSDVWVFESFALENSIGTRLVNLDSAGNLSLVSSLYTTGTLRFDTASTRGIISATDWKIGSENASVRQLVLQRNDGQRLDVEVDNILAVKVDNSLDFSDSLHFYQIIDSNNQYFSVIPIGTTTLRSLSSFSLSPVTVPTQTILFSSLGDLDEPDYIFDPSAESKIRDLEVSAPLPISGLLNIALNPLEATNYSSKLSIRTNLSTGSANVITVADQFFMTRLGEIDSRLDLEHMGSFELRDSSLKLGIGPSEVSIAKLSMTTLIILPNQSYDPMTASTQPLYYADHLHQHEEMGGIRYSQLARRDIDNTFDEMLRFSRDSESIRMQPSTTISAQWSNQNTTGSLRSVPIVLALSDTFLVAQGMDGSSILSSVLHYDSSSMVLNLTASDASFAATMAAFAADAQNGFVYSIGGITANNPIDDVSRLRLNDSDFDPSLNLPINLARSHAMSHSGNIYVFGGYTQSADGIHYVTQSIFRQPPALFSQAAIAHNLPQDLVETEIYVSLGRLYRSTANDFSSSHLIASEANDIVEAALSPNGFNVCYHTTDNKLYVRDLLLQKLTINGINGHSCQWGQGNEQDIVYFINSVNPEGELYKIRRDNTGLTSLGKPEIVARHLSISDQSEMAIVAKVSQNITGEELYIKKSDTTLHSVIGDGSSESPRIAQEIFHPLLEEGQLYFVSSALSSNLATNLFRANPDGSYQQQISHIPQGLLERPAILGSSEALLIVTAYASLANHIPVDFESGCVASFRGYAYLLGAGASENQVWQYNPHKDSYLQLSEPLPFENQPFACADNGAGLVYLKQGSRFWHYDLSGQKVYPLPDSPSANAGAMAYGNGLVWFLESQTAGISQFFNYNPSTLAWTAMADPGTFVENPTLAATDDFVLILGKGAAPFAKQYSIASNTFADSPAYWPLNRENPALLTLSSTRVIVAGGSELGTPVTSLADFTPSANVFSARAEMPVPISKAGVFSQGHQILLFGGVEQPRRLVIQPINASDSQNFVQVLKHSLISQSTQWETSAAAFMLAAKAKSDLVAYVNQNQAINIYNLNTKTHSNLIPTNPVLSLGFARNSDTIYYSHLDGGIEKIHRIKTDGTGALNISDSYLGTATVHRMGFVNEEESRIYFLRSAGANAFQVYRGYLNQITTVEEVLSDTNLTELAYYQNANMQQTQASALLLSPSTNLSTLSTYSYPGLYLNKVLRLNDSTVVSARAMDSNTNLYFWEDGSNSPLTLTQFSGTQWASLPSLSNRANQIRFWWTDGTAREMREGNLASLSSAPTLIANAEHGFSSRAINLEPTLQKSFLHDSRIYVIQGKDIYRSQTLGSSAVDLVFSSHDSQPLLLGDMFQVTQAKNRIYAYGLSSRKVYEYEPTGKSLREIYSVPSALGEGVLGASQSQLVFAAKDSVTGISVLTSILEEDSLIARSSEATAPESQPQRLMAINPAGRLYSQRFMGPANITVETISGGSGNTGVLDKSLGGSNFVANAVTNSAIAALSVSSISIASEQIPALALLADSVESKHLQSASISSSKLISESITTEKLAFATLETNRVQVSSLQDEDFAPEVIESRHISLLSITSASILSETLISGNIKRDSLLLEDFDSLAVSTKQVENFSILDEDIAPLTMETRHFREGSVVTTAVQNLSVTRDKIQPFSLETSRFQTQGIATIDIATQTITHDLLLTDAVTSIKIAAHTSGISTINIADLNITEDKIADLAIDRSKIATDAIVHDDINDFTITNRELGVGSIDTNKVINNSIHNVSLRTDALTIDKLADQSIGTLDIKDGEIISRHFYEGGKGDKFTRFNLPGLTARANRAALGIFENFLYILGGDGTQTGTKISLMDGSSTALSIPGLPADVSVYAASPSTLYIMSGLNLHGYDFNSESLNPAIVSPVYQPQAGQRGLYYNNRFFVIGPNTSSPSRSFHYQFSGDNWAGYNTASHPQSFMQPAGLGANIYYFGNGNLNTANNIGAGWTSSALLGLGDRQGSLTLASDDLLYIFGGTEGPNEILSYDPVSTNLTRLTTQNFSVNLANANSNQILLHQGRFYVVGFNGAMSDTLVVWHPRLDASIDNRNLVVDLVASANIQTNSLSSIVFATEAFDSSRIVDFTILNQDIENNVLLSNSIDKGILASVHFVDQAFTEDKIADASVDGRVIVSYSLIDSDFASSAITELKLASSSIGYEEIVSFTLTSQLIGTDQITLSKVAADSVLGEDINTGEINTVDLANLTIEADNIANEQLDSAHILNQNLVFRHFSPVSLSRDKFRTHTLLGDVFADGSITGSTQIIDLSIDSSHILSFNITLGKVTNQPGNRLVNSVFTANSLTDADFASESITEDKILTGSLGISIFESESLDDLSFAQNAITTDKLIVASFTESQMATKTLTFGNFLHFTLGNARFDSQSIFGPKLIDQTLVSDNFRSLSLGNSIAADAITDTRILDYSILDTTIADQQITASVLAEMSITGSQIQSNTLQTAKVANLQVTTRKLRPDNIRNQNIANVSISQNHIRDAGLTGINIATGVLDGDKLNASSLGGEEFMTGSIATSKLAAIHQESIARYQITSTQIRNQGILSASIAVDAITSSIKFATSDVFEGFNFANRSIRGDSIVSYTLRHDQIGNDQILAEHLTESVISPQYSKDLDAETAVTATTSAFQIASQNILKLQRVNETTIIAAVNSLNQLYQSVNGVNFNPLGPTCPTGSITAFFMLDTKYGYLACQNDLYYMSLDQSSLSSPVVQMPGTIKNLHFFDVSKGLILDVNGAVSTIRYTADGGKNSSVVASSQYLTPWTIWRDKVAFATTPPTPAAGALYTSANQGQSFSNCTYAASQAQVSLAYHQNSGRLYGVFEPNTVSWNTPQFTEVHPNCTHTNIVALPGDTGPWSMPINLSDRFYMGPSQNYSAGSVVGMLEVNLGTSSQRQIHPHFVSPASHEVPDLAILQEPFVLNSQTFVLPDNTQGAISVNLDIYQHIQAASLGNNSLADAALVTGIFLEQSIAGDRVLAGELSSRTIGSASFLHGDFSVRQMGSDVFDKVFSHNGTVILGLETGGHTLKRSTDSGVTWGAVNGVPDFTTKSAEIESCHLQGQAAICTTNKSFVIVSSDAGANFTEVTDTPFSRDIVGWAFDTNNFFAVGINNSNQMIGATYDSNTNQFIELRDQNGLIVIDATATQTFPQRLHFFDGNTGHLSVFNKDGGDQAAFLYSTTNRGKSWTGIAPVSDGSLASYFALDKDNFWASQGEILRLPDGSTVNPSCDELTAIHFFKPSHGLIVCDDKNVLYTTNGGTSFSDLFILPNQGNSIVTSGKGKALLSVVNHGLYEVSIRDLHQPFVNLTAADFSAADKIQAYQIRPAGLDANRIVDGSVGGDALAEASLTDQKMLNEAITVSKIRDRSLLAESIGLGALTAAKLGPDAISGTSIKAGIITSLQIQDGSITSRELASGALTGDALGEGSITEIKLRTGAMTGDILASGSILTTHIVDLSFEDGQFADGSFEGAHFQNETINTDRFVTPLNLTDDKIFPKTLLNSAFTAGSINSRILMDQSLYGRLFADFSLSNPELEDGSVQDIKWRENSIVHSMLGMDIVTVSRFGLEAVSGHHFIDRQITRDRFTVANSTIHSDLISNASFTAREFGAASIVSGKFSTLATQQLISSKIANQQIDASIVDGAILEPKFSDSAFDTNDLAENVVTNSRLASAILTRGHLGVSTIEGSKFANGSIEATHLVSGSDFFVKMQDDSILDTNISTRVLRGSYFLDSSIALDRFSPNSLFSGQLGSMDQSVLGAGSISGRALRVSTMTTLIVDDLQITADKIADLNLPGELLADDVITASNTASVVLSDGKFLPLTLLTEDFNPNFTNSKIKSDSLTGGEFVRGFLNESHFGLSVIPTAKLSDSGITSRVVLNGTILTDKINNVGLNVIRVFSDLADADFASDSIVGGSISGTLDSRVVLDGAITSAKVQDNQIGLASFQSGSIGGNKIAAGIDQAKLSNLVISNQKLSTTNKIQGTKLQDDQVTDAVILDYAITDAKVSGISGTKFASLNSDRIATHGLQSAAFENSTMDSDRIENGTINETVIFDGTLLNRSFANDSVNGDKITPGSLSPAKLANSAIGVGKIRNTTLDASDFADGAIGDVNVEDKAILGTHINFVDIPTARISDGSFNWGHLADGAIGSAQIGPRYLFTNAFGDSQVSLNKVTADPAINHFIFKDATFIGAQISGTMSGQKIANNQIERDNLALAAIPTAKLTDVILREKLVQDSVTRDKFTAGAFINTLAVIADNSLDHTNFVSDGTAINPNEKFPTKVMMGTNFDKILGTGFNWANSTAMHTLPSRLFKDLNASNFSTTVAEKLESAQIKDGIVGAASIPSGFLTVAHLSSSDSRIKNMFYLDAADTDTNVDGEHWHFRPLAPQTCPDGFSISPTDGEFCISTSDEAGQTPYALVNTCSSKGARLCNLAELTTACKDGTYVVSEFMAGKMLQVKKATNPSCNYEFQNSVDLNSGSYSGLCCMSH